MWADFEIVSGAAQGAGAAVAGPVPQGTFLGRLGIEARGALLSRARPDQAPVIHRQLHRLTHPRPDGRAVQGHRHLSSGRPRPARLRGARMTEPEVLTNPALAALPGVRHAFFTARGGVSQGVYASLNVGVGSRDDPAAVTENRRRCAAHFGQPLARLAPASKRIRRTHGSSPRPTRADGRRADALVTRPPGGWSAARCRRTARPCCWPIRRPASSPRRTRAGAARSAASSGTPDVHGAAGRVARAHHRRRWPLHRRRRPTRSARSSTPASVAADPAFDRFFTPPPRRRRPPPLRPARVRAAPAGRGRRRPRRLDRARHRRRAGVLFSNRRALPGRRARLRTLLSAIMLS
jgi:hypothetical protein